MANNTNANNTNIDTNANSIPSDAQILMVNVIEASGIKSTNVIGKQSDSFVTVHVNEKMVSQTRIVENSLSPKYNQVLRVPLSANIIQDTVQVFVYGSHWWSNEFIGRVEIPAPMIALVLNTAQHDTWLKLLPPQRCIDPKNRYPGFIHLGFSVEAPTEPSSPIGSPNAQKQAVTTQAPVVPSPQPNPLQCVAECPMCGIMFPQSVIVEHVNSCLEKGEKKEPNNEELPCYPPPYLPPQGAVANTIPTVFPPSVTQPCGFWIPQFQIQPTQIQGQQQVLPFILQQPLITGNQQLLAQLQPPPPPPQQQVMQQQQIPQLPPQMYTQQPQQNQLPTQQVPSQPQSQPQSQAQQLCTPFFTQMYPQMQNQQLQPQPQTPTQLQPQSPPQLQTQTQAQAQRQLQPQSQPQSQTQQLIQLLQPQMPPQPIPQLPSPPPVQLLLQGQPQQTPPPPQQQPPVLTGQSPLYLPTPSNQCYAFMQPYSGQKSL
ncbi:hypothetical protein Pelo_11668 [Pelomyxa schiedti]|nr:hypothetical protein Pelo_11668 [Pelomyxa schiedti]